MSKSNLKAYGCLLLALLNVFMLGVFTASTVYETKEIQLYKWILASLFVVVYLGIFLQKYKRLNIDPL
jgi:hypothetical protein